jgi:DNA repair protein RecO (recombination protein O)
MGTTEAGALAPAARSGSRRARDGERVVHEPAFVLHATPWRETSLVIELLTRDHGRIACVAKGAKRPTSALRSVLLAFQPLQVGWSGRQELRTLTSAEWLGGMAAPQGDGLLCGFYMNELVVKLLPREDAHPALFDGYAKALVALGLGESLEATLRRFEWLLLREIGYAVNLRQDVDQRPIDPARQYWLLAGRGFVTAGSDGLDGEGAYSGATLLDIVADEYASSRTLAEAKRLTRVVLAEQLEGQTLKTRQILMDLQRL